MKTKLIKRGKYSYALPINKEQLKELNINPNEDIHVELDTDHFTHRLIVQSQSEYDYNQKHSTLSQMFDKFFEEHPEIKDREAYLKQVYEMELKSTTSESTTID